MDTTRVAKLTEYVVVQYYICFGRCCPTDESLDSSRVAKLTQNVQSVAILEMRAWICRVLQKLTQHVVVFGLAPCYHGGENLNASRVAKFEQAHGRIWLSHVFSGG